MSTLASSLTLPALRPALSLGRNANIVVWTLQLTLAWYLAFDGMRLCASFSPALATAFGSTVRTGSALPGVLEIAAALVLLLGRSVAGGAARLLLAAIGGLSASGDPSPKRRAGRGKR